MPPAARRTCDYPGCRKGPRGENGEENPFITDEALTTRADVSAELDKHVEMAHLLPIRLEENNKFCKKYLNLNKCFISYYLFITTKYQYLRECP